MMMIGNCLHLRLKTDRVKRQRPRSLQKAAQAFPVRTARHNIARCSKDVT